MHVYNRSRLFIKIQGVTANKSSQERSSSTMIHKKLISFPYSRLQDKRSEVVESNIFGVNPGVCTHRISTSTYDTSYFSTCCCTSHESNQSTPQKGSIFFMGDNDTHKTMTSNDTRLAVANRRSHYF